MFDGSSGKDASGLPGGDHADADQRQVEGAHTPGSDAGHQALRGAEKVPGHGEPEGAHRPASGDGGERPAHPHGVPGGAAPGGVHPHRAGVQPQARPGRHAELGRGVQDQERERNIDRISTA